MHRGGKYRTGYRNRHWGERDPGHGVKGPMNGRGDVCGWFIKTGHCKYGDKCKFLHDASAVVHVGNGQIRSADPRANLAGYTEAGLPIRPGERLCGLYAKTGNCHYGAKCRFTHVPGGHRPKTPLGPVAHHNEMGPHNRVPPHFPHYGLRHGYYPDGHKAHKILAAHAAPPVSHASNSNFCKAHSPPHPKHWMNGSTTHQGNNAHGREDGPVSGNNYGPKGQHRNGDNGYFTDSAPVAENNMYGSGGKGHIPVNGYDAWLDSGSDTPSSKGQGWAGSVYKGYFASCWPYVASPWYPPGIPNEVMRKRMEAEPQDVPRPGEVVTRAAFLLKPERKERGLDGAVQFNVGSKPTAFNGSHITMASPFQRGALKA